MDLYAKCRTQNSSRVIARLRIVYTSLAQATFHRCLYRLTPQSDFFIVGPQVLHRTVLVNLCRTLLVVKDTYASNRVNSVSRIRQTLQSKALARSRRAMFLGSYTSKRQCSLRKTVKPHPGGGATCSSPHSSRRRSISTCNISGSAVSGGMRRSNLSEASKNRSSPRVCRSA